MSLYLSPQFRNMTFIYSFAPLRTLLLKAYRRIGAWSFIIWKFSGHPTTSILTGMYTGSIPSIWEKACHAKLCNNVMTFKNALQRPPLSSCKIDAAWCKLCRLQSLNRARKTCASLNYNFMVFIEKLHNGTHEASRYRIKRCTIIVAWHTPYRLVNLCRRPTCHCGQWSQSFDNRMVIALPRLDWVQKLLLFCHARWLDSNLKKKIKKTIRDVGRRKIFHSTHPILDGMRDHSKLCYLITSLLTESLAYPEYVILQTTYSKNE